MQPHKKGSQWEITYRASGYKHTFTERYRSFDEALKRCATIEYEKKTGRFIPKAIFDMGDAVEVDPYMTFGELLEQYTKLYGEKNWKPAYLSSVKQRINNYILPDIGEVQLRMLSDTVLMKYFDRLYDREVVPRIGQNTDGELLSVELIKKISMIISGACSFAMDRGYIQHNPATQIRIAGSSTSARVPTWTAEETLRAIKTCDKRILRLCIILAFYCTLRVGEVTALCWDHVDISDEAIANGNACIHIDRELQRINIEELKAFKRHNRDKVFHIFPKVNEDSTSVLALISPKTQSSIRSIYLPRYAALALKEEKERQQELKNMLRGGYEDNNLVIAFDNGRPVEAGKVNKMLRDFCEKSGMRKITFHSLRHTSVTEKLRISGGDIKSVQGDAGHSTARMVTDQYAEIQDGPRQTLAIKMDRMGEPDAPATPVADPVSPAAEPAPGSEMERACELLKQNPALASMLLAFSKTPQS